MFDTTLFNISPTLMEQDESKALILSGCRVTLSENITYSELDELSYYVLNNNDYESGRIDIELSFNITYKNPYFKYFVQCVSIRVDKETLCKINYNPLSEKLKISNYTKITKEGKLALGISYYFKSEDEKKLVMNCNSFCIEGFFALKRKSKVYGFMCRVNLINNEWILSEGNTYRTFKCISIRHLYH